MSKLIIYVTFILLLTGCAAVSVVEEFEETNLTKEVLEMLYNISSYEAEFELHFVSNRGINVYQMIETENSIRVLSPETLKDSIITLREGNRTFLSNFLYLMGEIPKTVDTNGDSVIISLIVDVSPYIYSQVLTTENKEFKSLISYDINGEERMKIFFTSIILGE